MKGERVVRVFVFLLAFGAAAMAAPAPAAAGERAAYAPFGVVRTPVRAGHALATLNVAGEAVDLRFYGRKARARLHDAAEELKHARAMGAVFDGAPQPALVTLEMRLHF